MKIIVTRLVVLLAFSVSSSSAKDLRGNNNNNNNDPLELESRFRDWMNRFDKQYESATEFAKRMKIWIGNHELITEHNEKIPPPSYTLGHNQFSDLSFDEYKYYNKLGEYSPGIQQPPPESFQKKKEQQIYAASERRLLEFDDDVPSQKNWVEEGAVPPVKNQGMCGSCWAFSAIGAIEGAHYLDTGKLVSLSEQELVDCDKSDLGCSGGLMDNAFLFDENSTGLCSEVDYPYEGWKRYFSGCALTKDPSYCKGVPHTRVSIFIDVTNTVKDLVAALSKQPVSVAIEADKQSFQFYKSGVYDDPDCGNKLDHGVLAVGYGTDDDSDDSGKDYFLVRNSWGETWGAEGYIKMARTTSETNVNGTCGILSMASRPILRDD